MSGEVTAIKSNTMFGFKRITPTQAYHLAASEILVVCDRFRIVIYVRQHIR